MKNLFLTLLFMVFVISGVFAQWAQINSNVTGNIYEMKFINETTGFCISDNGILKTSDGGNTWSLMVDFPRGNTLTFSTESNWYVTNYSHEVYKSTDAGMTWTLNKSFPGNENPQDLFFTSSEIGYLITAISGPPGGSFIYKTTNGGSDWQQTNSFPTMMTLQSITFANKDTGYVVGHNGKILKTYNAGATWSLLQTTNYGTFISVCFPSSKIGYAVGYPSGFGSQICKTVDAGHTWRSLDTKGNFNTGLRGVYFCNEDIGYAVGENSTIIYTNDGGETWQNMVSPVKETFYSTWFINPMLGFVVGSNGTILKTSNGGVTGIKENGLKSGLKVYPNPASNEMTIESNDPTLKNYILTLNNMEGKNILVKNIEFANNHKLQLQDLENGIYFLTIISDRIKSVTKIVIQK